MTTVRRGDVYLVDLAPTRGKEMRKARPCAVVSPDVMNDGFGLFIVAPMTSGSHPYPFRVPCRFGGVDGHVVLDQLRSVDETRLVKRIGALTSVTLSKTLAVLREMFEP
jgi:mRNA interferase MazF